MIGRGKTFGDRQQTYRHRCINGMHTYIYGYPLTFDTIPFNSVISYRGNFSFLISVVYLFVYLVTIFPCHFPHVWRETLRYICFACYFYIKKYIYWKDSYLPSRSFFPDDNYVFLLTFGFICINLCYLLSFSRFEVFYFFLFFIYYMITTLYL